MCLISFVKWYPDKYKYINTENADERAYSASWRLFTSAFASAKSADVATQVTSIYSLNSIHLYNFISILLLLVNADAIQKLA